MNPDERGSGDDERGVGNDERGVRNEERGTEDEDSGPGGEDQVPDSDDWCPERRDAGGAEIPETEEIVDEVAGISLSPAEHQRIKDLVNGDRLDEIKRYERRYLVVGAGGADGAASRRETVYSILDGRRTPPSVAMKLEEFGLSRDELKLWCRVFDILCGEASHVVCVFEDFDGGYVWELGLVFAPSYREKTWVLKRRYLDEDRELERYENGMAASHVELLLTGDRCYEWVDRDDLVEAVENVP